MSGPNHNQPVRRMSDDEARMFVAPPAQETWTEVSGPNHNQADQARGPFTGYTGGIAAKDVPPPRRLPRTLDTGWTSSDPQMMLLLRRVQDEHDPATRLELEAALHTWQAQDCVRRAAQLRGEVSS